MQSTVTIPQELTLQSITEFRFRPGSKDVTVILLVAGERQAVTINIQSLLDAMTATHKNTVRTWYKQQATLAIDTYNDQSGAVATPIDGEAFDDV
jgi:hypothetical protein